MPRRLATAAGRITYQMFEPAWSHVVTSTLSATIWRNSQILGPSGNEVFYAKLTPAS